MQDTEKPEYGYYYETKRVSYQTPFGMSFKVPVETVNHMNIGSKSAINISNVLSAVE